MTISVVRQYTSTLGGSEHQSLPDPGIVGFTPWTQPDPGDIMLVAFEMGAETPDTLVYVDTELPVPGVAFLLETFGANGTAPHSGWFGKYLLPHDFDISGALRPVMLNNDVVAGRRQIVIIRSTTGFASDPAEYCPAAYRGPPYNGTPGGSPYTAYSKADTALSMFVGAAISFGSGSSGANIRTKWDGAADLPPYFSESTTGGVGGAGQGTNLNAGQMDYKIYAPGNTGILFQLVNLQALNKAVSVITIMSKTPLTRQLSGKGRTVARGVGPLRKGGFTGLGPTVARGRAATQAFHVIHGKANTVAVGFGHLSVTRTPKLSKGRTVARGTGALRRAGAIPGGKGRTVARGTGQLYNPNAPPVGTGELVLGFQLG